MDVNSADSPWAGVGAITINGSVYSGVLIDCQHVRTAAHVLAGYAGSLGSVSFSLNVGSDLTHTLDVSTISVYPGFSGTTPGAWHDDLAIVRLSAPVSDGVPAYDLYGGSLKGKTITLVGYGGGGDGVNGVTRGASASVKRLGKNRVDRISLDDDGGSKTKYFYSILMARHAAAMSLARAINRPT